MSEPLEEAFYRYMEKIVSALQAERTKHSHTLAVYPAFETTLLGKVLGDVERSDEFRLLVEASRPLSPPEASVYKAESAAKNFFRRSGIYGELQTGRIPDVAPALDTYRAGFSRTTEKITSMAPLDFLHMEGTELRFQTFRLRKFTKAELETALQQRVNRTYYKEAVLELENLHNFWWLIADVDAAIQCPPPNREEPDRRVPMHLTKHPTIETPLRVLALYKWQLLPYFISFFEDGFPDGTWLAPAVPFVLSVNDNLLRGPEWIETKPDGLRLALQYDEDGNHTDDEGPLDYWNFDSDRMEQFATFLRGAEQMLLSLQKIEDWRFLQVALDYVLKGFESKGKEQLVWHIVALEALLAHKGESITDSIARRLGQILGADEAERKQVRKKFRELYDFRCDVVHGNGADKEVEWNHLNEARYYARDALVWFLHYLTAVHTHWTTNHPTLPLPNRKDLLGFLDLSQTAMRGVSALWQAMPEGFPHVPKWLE